MRRSNKKINNTLKKQIVSTFSQLLTDFKDKEETDKFIKDFFTDAELENFSKRLAIAYWLRKGRSYVNIRENLKVSSATVSSVQEMMGKSGFKLALKMLEAEEWANQWADRIKKIVGKKK